MSRPRALDERTRPDAAPKWSGAERRRPHLLVWGLVSSSIAAVWAVALVAPGTLVPVAIAAAVTQVLLARFVLRRGDRPLRLTSLFVVVWGVMFTLRLAELSVGPNRLTDHPLVVNASREDIAAIWVLTTAALAAFVGGVLLSEKTVPAARLPDVRLSRQGIVALFAIFIGSYFVLAVGHVNSGILVNVSELYLFGVAFGAYQSASRGRTVGVEILAVIGAGSLAILFGFKELAVLPVVAWMIGHFSAQRRLITLTTVGVALIGLVFFVGIQSQRDAALYGDRTDFIGATVQGLREYDYPTGLRRHKSGIDIPINAIAAVTSRMRGADSLFVLRAQVPHPVPFMHGESLWEPILSVVPGMSRILALDFKQLSLGRYFNITFWSLRPNIDVSSQPLTVPGDFFLNFGTGGVVGGLALVGFCYGAIDRRTPVCSPVSAGLFAYAAIPLLSIERNFAYLLVTGLIRYSLGLLLISFVSHAVLHRASVPGKTGGLGVSTSRAGAA